MSTRLAVVNWRDPWHPAAGGAERYAWEVARGMALRGSQVTYITARARGQKRREQVEDVTFVRLGGRFTVYPLVLLWLLLHRRSFDVVIDCQNGIPFFSPWVLPRRVPVFCVVHHVHDDQFGMYFPPWLAWVGRVLEGPVSRWTYRRHSFVVVSSSTLRAVRERLGWTGPAHVVHNGSVVADPNVEDAPGTRGDPDLVCVTRLVPYKRLGLLLDLAERLAARRPGLRLHVVGDGPEAAALADGIAARGLTGVVVPHGYVSEEVKAALVARADLHLSTSRGEGWGLSVIEAAALGVPTVAGDVDGLRDAVRDDVTGWLVPSGGDYLDVVERALKELDDPARRAAVAAACRGRAAGFDWDRTTERVAALVAAAVPRYGDATDEGTTHHRTTEGTRRDHGRRRG
ncbi:glycosyltransferase family 4 protein [Actinomadura algeriensis]|uniref:Glycosyltransferase involved in cell wall biosynthesis n=1 Tax=Actinomadura algeriensis TaxID=1679523 RepID=A0ABR9JLU3_9ACTN|nr:glycosyltransferase family 4 protein [Actinomadura algeriensis]MBE1531346.1 glycosyltransferase involved in cell wall biosynthesis [Actinomadura algeriensis]